MRLEEMEQYRKLTEIEKQRLKKFEQVKIDLISNGYAVKELTIGMIRASLYALLMTIPVIAITIVPFLMVNRDRHVKDSLTIKSTILLFLCIVVLSVLHELIHGLTWGIFAEDHFESIEFGFVKEYFTPYCTCEIPLTKWQYLTGTLTPLIVLGIIPTVISIITGSWFLYWVGVSMILSAGGDMLIAAKLIPYRSQTQKMLIYDHPTQAGSVLFER